MARGSNEVEAGMNACVVVAVECALYLQLLLEVCFKLGIDEFHNGLVAGGETQEMVYRCKVNPWVVAAKHL